MHTVAILTLAAIGLTSFGAAADSPKMVPIDDAAVPPPPISASRTQPLPPSYPMRYRYKHLIAGSMVLAPLYIASFAVGATHGEWALAAPIVGPVIQLTKLGDCRGGPLECFGSMLLYGFFLILDAGGQLAGTILLLAGMSRVPDVPKRPRRPKVLVSPAAFATGAGLSLVGEF